MPAEETEVDRLPLRRTLAAAAAVATAVLSTSCSVAPAPTRAPAAGWHLSWRAETVFFANTSATTTCRFLARLTGSGSRVRAEFTSPAGGHGYTILSASIARPLAPSSLEVDVRSSEPLTFGTTDTAIVRPSSAVLSDPVPLDVVPQTSVLVTVTASAGAAFTKGSLVEPGGCSRAAVSQPATAPAGAFPAAGNVRWLRSLLVDGDAQRSVAAAGDSITEGSSFGYQRWTDRVADTGISTANAGVSGGALTRPGVYGTELGTDRVRALLAEPGVTDLVLALGTNDLAMQRTASQVLSGTADVISQAQAAHVRLWVCTILPRTGAGWTATQEQAREQINSSFTGAWLKTRGVSVIDADLAMRNPRSIRTLLPAYDSGDHLHPNAVGQHALGETIRTALQLEAPPSVPLTNVSALPIVLPPVGSAAQSGPVVPTAPGRNQARTPNQLTRILNTPVP